jgi:AcrR family transcriptional regulator
MRPVKNPVGRQRPRTHSGDQPAEIAIFEATERLLAEQPLHELSVAKIIAEADLSRASFYHYFGSKFDVLVALMGRIFDAIYAETHDELEAPWDNPEEALRSTLGAALETWEEHRHVINGALENMHSVESLAEVWMALRGRFIVVLSAQIERERAAGRAVPGLPPEGVATLAVCAAERIFYVGATGKDPYLQTPEQRLDAIVAIALSAIYGSPKGPA